MIYLSSFKLSERKVNNPNIYPYNVFRDKYIEPFVFIPITVFYGNNGSGKSTLLNIIANCLQLKGKEYATSNSFGSVDYCDSFSSECLYTFGEDDYGNTIKKIPGNSRYIKSEDILYEIKKIQQKQILSDGMEYDYVKRGMSLLEAKTFLTSKEGRKQEEYIKFAQEKYSNGETSMQYFEEYLQPDALYLLDEPEVSLSPANQVMLAEEINKMARLLECQFIIATHSPFMLGTLNAILDNQFLGIIANMDDASFRQVFYLLTEGIVFNIMEEENGHTNLYLAKESTTAFIQLLPGLQPIVEGLLPESMASNATFKNLLGYLMANDENGLPYLWNSANTIDLGLGLLPPK